MALKLPQARTSQAPQRRGADVPVEALISVMGNNPYAQAINQITPQLSQALERRAQLKKKAEQMAALEKLAGAEQGAYAGLDDGVASSLASSQLSEQRALKAKQLKLDEDRKEIRNLEKIGGFAEGELGDDPSMAKLVYTQKSIGQRAENNPNLDLRKRGLDLAESDRFKNRINIQKQRLISDPRVKPLFAQDIGLKQVGDIMKMVEGGNTVAAGALGVKMAKAMGEVGVLTDQDVARYVVSGRLDRMAADKLSKMLRGVPSDATQAEISQIASVLSDSFAEKIQPVYNEYIDSFAEVEGMDPLDVARKMSLSYVPRAMPDLGTGKPGALPTTPKKATMRWNPQTGRVEPVQ